MINELITKYIFNKTNLEKINLLDQLWQKEAILLELDTYDNDVIDYLFSSLFDPFKRSSSLVERIYELPKTDVFNDYNFYLDELLTDGLIFVFKGFNSEYYTLTPEGYILLVLYKEYQIKNYSEFEIKIKKYQNYLYNEYRKNTFKKILENKELVKKEQKLNEKQVAISLFLLINGNIGKEKPFVYDYEDATHQKISDSVVSVLEPFVGKIESERNYGFNYYITTANSAMGNVFNVKKRDYFIHKDKVDILLYFLTNSVNNVEDFDPKLQSLLDNYNDIRHIFRSYNICYYSKPFVLNLLNKLRRGSDD